MQVETQRRPVRRVTNGKGGSLRAFKALAHRAHRHQTAAAMRLVADGRLDEADIDLTPAPPAVRAELRRTTAPRQEVD